MYYNRQSIVSIGTMKLHKIEHQSVEQLQKLQLQRLQNTIHYVYQKSQFYRIQFDKAGVKPEDLRQLSDLQKFPFTVKTDLRDNYPFGMFCVARDQITRIHASSGTTGQATVVGYTKEDINDWSDVVARSIAAAGGKAGDMVHVIYGYGLFTGGLGAHYGAERLGCTVVPISGGQTKRQVQLLQDFNPDIVMVTPSYMLNILEEIERQNIDISHFNLRCGLFGAEPWTKGVREVIEQKLQIKALDIYGLSEIMGPGVAQECEEDRGVLTVWEDYFYPEVVCPETGEVLPEGQEGELVFTSLTKRALPIIRYRTRDLTRLLPPIDRPFRRMDKIVGRSDDMLIIRGVNVFPTQIQERVLAIPGLGPHFIIEVTCEGHLDQLTVKVEVEGGQSTQLAARLQADIKDLIGVSAVVECKTVGSLVRSEGKYRVVYDLRGKK